ncbi:hypothetical protein Trydic_g9066 [Trypoxylus dichotomus]
MSSPFRQTKTLLAVLIFARLAYCPFCRRKKIVDGQLRSHLSKFHLLPTFQSGFHPGFSCMPALTCIVDDILSTTDIGDLTVLVLLDFSKAFNRVDHSLLLAILHYIDLGEVALHFFRAYLLGRKQAVVAGGKVSD